jgi:hypothetical protein
MNTAFAHKVRAITRWRKFMDNHRIHPNSEGKRAALGNYSDITERKAAEDEARKRRCTNLPARNEELGQVCLLGIARSVKSH